WPGQVDRRIQHVRVVFPDLVREGGEPYAYLTQLANHRYRSRDRRKVLTNVLGFQSLALSAAETDTRSLARPGRRLAAFQGTGPHATWRLSIPGVVKALAEKRGETQHHAMLKERVREIVLEVGYTARRG